MRANNFSSNVISEADLILPKAGHSANFIRLRRAQKRPAAVVNLQQGLLRYKYCPRLDFFLICERQLFEKNNYL